MTATRPRYDMESVNRLAELGDYVVPFAIRVASELGIADLLVDGPRPVAELAQVLDAHSPSLMRLMRTLACKGIFCEPEPEVVGLTPLAEPLRSDHPLSLREAYPLLACDIAAWGHLDHSVRTGQAAFEHAHSRPYWEYMADHPDENLRFNRSQQAATRLELRASLPAYDWGSLRTLVDLGGGNGAFLAGILARFKQVHGILLDQPHVMSGAPEVLAEAGVADRCEVIGGSFFERVPRGADAYILKRVLYHWDDERSLRLLQGIREAMYPQSRLLIVEPVIVHGQTNAFGALSDLLLLTMAGGGARTRDQLEQLLAQAGLRLNRLIPTFMNPIAEAVPAV